MTSAQPIVGLDLNIDDNYLAECVRQTVIMGISESLNRKNEIVSTLVRAVLDTKCTEDGRISSYERENRYTIIEAYMRKTIKETAQEEIKRVIDEHTDEIREAIYEELSKQETMDDLVSQYLVALKKSLSSYCTDITVNFDFKKHNTDY